MERRYGVREAADALGVSIKTLQRWDREGRFVPEARTPTQRRIYSQSQINQFANVIGKKADPVRLIAYCRVSSQAQRPDLTNQRRVLEEFAVAKGLSDVEFIEEIGGGLNFKRPKFIQLMDAIGRREVKTLIIAHPDRLTRFGFDWFAHYAATNGCSLMVLNQERLSPEEEVVQDLMTVVHCFSSRLYGLRSYKKTLKKALDEDRA